MIESGFLCRNGDITELSVHAIVHSTNEKMTDRSSITDKLFLKAGPKLQADIRNNIKGTFSRYSSN